MKKFIILAIALIALAFSFLVFQKYFKADNSAPIKSIKTEVNKDSSNNIPQIVLPITEETAKQIAEKEWLKIYGSKVLDEKPYIATLINDSLWNVSGSFNNPQHKKMCGGVAYITIRKNDGMIFKIGHGK